MNRSSLLFLSLIAMPFVAGSQTWQLQHQRPDLELSDCHFQDNQNGYVAGDSSVSGAFISSVILITNDGGQNWNTVSVNNPAYRIKKICVLSTGEIFAAGRGSGGNNGMFTKSVDGGISWMPASSFNERLNNVYFKNSSEGFVMGRNGALAMTTNGGALFVKLFVTGEDINCINFFNGTTGIMCAGGGEVFRTTDGGSTWSPVPSGVADDLLSISISGNEAWICGEAGTVIHSADMGLTWASQTTATGIDLNDIAFPVGTHGWVAGLAGVMNNSVDGGGNWQSNSSNTTMEITALSVPDVSHGWFCTTNGDIYYLGSATGVESLSEAGEEIHIYPNPVHDFMIIDTGAAQGLTYSITNSRGQLVHASEIKNQGHTTFGVSGLSGGIYHFIYTDNKNKYQQSVSFIKQ